jgi:replicative superfamily II helicase
MSFFADIGLFLIDEVHILADERGPAVRITCTSSHAAHVATLVSLC